MKKILIVSKFMHHVGGVETYIDWQAKHLPSAGYQCAFFGMAGPAGQPMDSVAKDLYPAPYRSYTGSNGQVLKSALDSVYSLATQRRFKAAIEQFGPDVIHFHGTCYQLTSSVAASASWKNIPSVVTAHEYKFACANQRLWNDKTNLPCNLCVGKSALGKSKAIVTQCCVKGSLAPSLLAATEQALSAKIWNRLQPVIHAPSRYMRDLLISDGISGNIKYHDLPWAPMRLVRRSPSGSGQFVFAYLGRLVAEKGVDALIRAWPEVKRRCPQAQLRIYGSGVQELALPNLAEQLGGRDITFMGRYEIHDLAHIMGEIDATVHPSIWAENSPYTVRESLQYGVPAVVSNRGGLPEMVSQATGSVFDVSSVTSLSNALVKEVKLRRAGSGPLVRAVEARRVTDLVHLEALGSIYELARTSRSRRSGTEPYDVS